MFERFKQIPCVVGFFAVVIIVPIIALAGVKSVTVDPTPIIVGNGVTYTIIKDDGNVVLNYSLQYQCLMGGAGPWAPNPADTNSNGVFSYWENRVGSFNLQPGVLLQTQAYPPMSSWVYSSKSVAVIGPDTETITAGLNTNSGTPVPNSNPALPDVMWLDVHFSIFAGSTRLGSTIDGYVQERIRRPQKPPPYDDSGWSGPDADLFYWDGGGGYIVDRKVTGYASDFQAASIGDVIDDFYQRNRFIINNCKIEQTEFLFPEHHFQRIKTGNTTWQLIEL